MINGGTFALVPHRNNNHEKQFHVATMKTRKKRMKWKLLSSIAVLNSSHHPPSVTATHVIEFNEKCCRSLSLSPKMAVDPRWQAMGNALDIAGDARHSHKPKSKRATMMAQFELNTNSLKPSENISSYTQASVAAIHSIRRNHCDALRVVCATSTQIRMTAHAVTLIKCC